MYTLQILKVSCIPLYLFTRKESSSSQSFHMVIPIIRNLIGVICVYSKDFWEWMRWRHYLLYFTGAFMAFIASRSIHDDFNPLDNAWNYSSKYAGNKILSLQVQERSSNNIVLDAFRNHFNGSCVYGKSPFPAIDSFIESIASIGNVSG